MNASQFPRIQHQWTTDGKPVCSACNKIGHVMLTCHASRRAPSPGPRIVELSPESQRRAYSNPPYQQNGNNHLHYRSRLALPATDRDTRTGSASRESSVERNQSMPKSDRVKSVRFDKRLSIHPVDSGSESELRRENSVLREQVRRLSDSQGSDSTSSMKNYMLTPSSMICHHDLRDLSPLPYGCSYSPVCSLPPSLPTNKHYRFRVPILSHSGLRYLCTQDKLF